MNRKFDDRMIASSRLVVLLTFLLLVLLVILTACSVQPNVLTALNGQEVTLAPGQNASLSGEPLKVQFIKVVNDSRCPKGVECYWEGEVSCLIEVTYHDVQKKMVLTQMSGSDETGVPFVDYIFAFAVEPYPVAAKTIRPGDYRLKLTIYKGKTVAT